MTIDKSGNGTQCPTPTTKTIDCDDDLCSIDCSGSWTNQGICLEECGKGTQEQVFTVTTEKKGQGALCPTQTTKTIDCTGTNCDSYCKPSTSDTTSPNPSKVLTDMRDMQDKDYFNNMDQETCCTDILTQANIETNKNPAGNMVKGSMCFLNNLMQGNPTVLNNFRADMNKSFPECGENYFNSTNVTSDCSE